jgi:hypothetical protein
MQPLSEASIGLSVAVNRAAIAGFARLWLESSKPHARYEGEKIDHGFRDFIRRA